MAGIGPKLPLQTNPKDGFGLTKTVRENIQQSLKMLLLTNPGERVMIPRYGVGLRNFLFEQHTPVTTALIIARIETQLSEFMPFVKLIDVDIPEKIDGIDARDLNALRLRIIYEVPNIHGRDELDLYLENLGPY